MRGVSFKTKEKWRRLMINTSHYSDSDSETCLLNDMNLEIVQEQTQSQKQFHKQSKKKGGKQTRTEKRNRLNTGDSATGENLDQYNGLNNDQKLSLILSKLSANESRMKSLETKLDFAFEKSGSRFTTVEKKMDIQDRRIKVLEYKSIDLEARTRRKNLIFQDFCESRDQSCTNIITEFLKAKMNISEDIVIDRAHRLGRFKSSTIRPIIVALRDYTATERIMSATHTLWVNRDFPPEITAARKELWPHYKQLKSKFPTSSVRLQFPAKLLKDGEIVIDIFPDWAEIINTSHVNNNLTITTTNTKSTVIPAHAHVVQRPLQQKQSKAPPTDTN